MYGDSYPNKMGCGSLQAYSIAKVTSVHHSSLTDKSLSLPNNVYFHFTLGNTSTEHTCQCHTTLCICLSVQRRHDIHVVCCSTHCKGMNNTSPSVIHSHTSFTRSSSVTLFSRCCGLPNNFRRREELAQSSSTYRNCAPNMLSKSNPDGKVSKV